MVIRHFQTELPFSLCTSAYSSPVTCVCCLLLRSFSVSVLSCDVIISLALRSSPAESRASFLALRRMSMWRCRDSTRCCREEVEQRWLFISILLFLLFSPPVPRSHGSCCLSSNRRKRVLLPETQRAKKKKKKPSTESLFSCYGWELTGICKIVCVFTSENCDIFNH